MGVMAEMTDNRTHGEDGSLVTNASVATLADTNGLELVETYSAAEKAAFSLVSITLVLYCGMSACLLQKTKKTPFAAKFLGTGLLIFDSMFSLFSTLRKFFNMPLFNSTIVAITNTWGVLAFVTIWISTLERCFLFSRPNLYLRIFTENRMKIIVTSTWLFNAVLFLTLRYGVCYLTNKSMKVFTTAGYCNSISLKTLMVLAFLICITSVLAYAIILQVVCEKTYGSRHHTSNILCGFKSSMLVLAHATVTTIVLSLLALGIFLKNSNNLSVRGFRLFTDIVVQVNCFLDPLLYSIWYKECRLLMLEILAGYSETVAMLSLKMRYEIYNIMLVNSTTNLLKPNSVHPQIMFEPPAPSDVGERLGSQVDRGHKTARFKTVLKLEGTLSPVLCPATGQTEISIQTISGSSVSI